MIEPVGFWGPLTDDCDVPGYDVQGLPSAHCAVAVMVCDPAVRHAVAIDSVTEELGPEELADPASLPSSKSETLEPPHVPVAVAVAVTYPFASGLPTWSDTGH